MTITLRIVLIVVSILTNVMIMRKIHSSKLQIEDSIFWIGFSSILILFSLFPGLPDLLSRLAGTYTTANFIYLAVIFLLILKMFHMSLKLSQLETKLKDLAQEMALEDNRRRQCERQKSAGSKAPACLRECAGFAESVCHESGNGRRVPAMQPDRATAGEFSCEQQLKNSGFM